MCIDRIQIQLDFACVIERDYIFQTLFQCLADLPWLIADNLRRNSWDIQGAYVSIEMYSLPSVLKNETRPPDRGDPFKARSGWCHVIDRLRGRDFEADFNGFVRYEWTLGSPILFEVDDVVIRKHLEVIVNALDVTVEPPG